MFLKPANSDMENGFKIFFLNIRNWELEKTILERHQNNKAMGVNCFT